MPQAASSVMGVSGSPRFARNIGTPQLPLADWTRTGLPALLGLAEVQQFHMSACAELLKNRSMGCTVLALRPRLAMRSGLVATTYEETAFSVQRHGTAPAWVRKSTTAQRMPAVSARIEPSEAVAQARPALRFSAHTSQSCTHCWHAPAATFK